jgi:hypothetical protein
MHNELTRLSYLFVVLPILLLSGFYASSTIFTDTDSYSLNKAFAQLTPQTPIIQIQSTSSYLDDFGNLHIVGEVNNTSIAPQTNVVAGALFYNITTNELVGNYSAFTSLETLRPGELSPYHIVVDDPQVLGNSIEFFTSSQDGPAKPSNLVLNLTNTFVDEMGNPHIAGNIINQGFFPESFANLIATYYDNSSQGVIGTETFGIDLGNISQGQLAWFDLAIVDNKTKNQAQFFSLNVESNESSMDYPLNVKRPLYDTLDGGFANTATSGLFGDPLIDLNQGISSNSFDNNVGRSFSSTSPTTSGPVTTTTNPSPSSTGNDIAIDIDIGQDPISPGNVQTIDVTVSDPDTGQNILGAEAAGKVRYETGSFENLGQFDEITNSEGKVEHEWRISGNAREGTFDVLVDVEADGYEPESAQTSFEVVPRNNTSDNDDNVEDNGLSEQQETQQPSEDDTSTNEVSDTETSSEDENGDDSVNNGSNDEGSGGDSSNDDGGNNGDGGDEGSSNNNDNDDSGNGDEGGNGEEEN